MARVWDPFMLNDELDMLECRLRTMPWVYRHIVVEANCDHRGNPKPYYFAENRELFSPWLDRIIHVRVDLSEMGSASPWDRLLVQHDAGARGLTDAGPEDFVLITDVDELLPGGSQAQFGRHWLTGFRPRIMMYAVDWEYPGRYEGLPEPRVLRAAYLTTLTDARNSRDVREYPETRMGWHLTWLGGVEAQTRKLDENCHTEATPDQRERVASGRAYREGLHISGQQMIPVDVDETWPEYVHGGLCPPSWYRPRA